MSRARFTGRVCSGWTLALRLWATVLIFVRVLGVVFVVIGTIFAVIQAETFAQGLAVLLIGGPLAALFASGGSGGARTLDERVHEISAGLRCPVCLNLSVADSPSNLAGEMRTEIETQLRSGRSPEQIRAFFIDRYGEWILLSPPAQGWNLLPWAVPIGGVVAGVALWAAFVRRRAPGTAGEVTETEHRRIEHDLADLEEPG